MESLKLKIGITHGDFNGIGYEVILKTLDDPRIVEMCTPVIYGSTKMSSYYRKLLNLSAPPLNSIAVAQQAKEKTANIINCLNDENAKVESGKATEASGSSAFIALEKAVKDLIDKHIDVLVTAPIHKTNIQSDSFKFPGHTEYISKQTQVADADTLMLMCNETMRIGVVTGHIPLAKVATDLTTELVYHKIKVLHRSLISDFGINAPKIAVLGINPHAGDHGVIGKEDDLVVAPAIQRAFHEGINAIGPFPADGFFGSEQFEQFDGVLAMYHDQGLIPFKLVAFDDGVNFTAGLPVVRTSPAHGTAFDIAGMGKASPNPFRNALFMAIDIFNNRKHYAEISKNPLPYSNHPE